MSESKAVPRQNSLPTIAIVGRPNVGKSSLFNAVIGRRMSIVHEESGVTRDRVIAPASFRGRHFQLIDTGGLGLLIGEKCGNDAWDARIAEQAIAAVEDADVLIFVTNVQDGVHNLDQEVARRLHMQGKPVLLAANKSDNPALGRQAAEFSELGFADIFPVSCLHNHGVESVLAAAVGKLPETPEGEAAGPATEERKQFRIAVVGRPNVGKSSLVNALLGEERVIVSDAAGTTRDAIDIDFELEYRGEMRPAVLVDTAGLRRRGKVDSVVEYFSVMRARSAIERADLVLFVTEASPDGVTAQDKTIASVVEKAGKGCVVVGNKFDLRRADCKREALEKELRRTLPGLKYAPLVFVSALERWNLGVLLDRVSQVLEQTEVKISTGLLNRVVADAVAERTPPVVGGAPLKIYYASMIGHEPPRVLIFVNHPKYCGQNYLAYLKNRLRSAFDLTGLPLEIILRARPKTVQSIHSAGRAPRRRRRKE